MTYQESIKPALCGAVAGAALLAIVGFSWGGWLTGGSAEQMASERAQMAVLTSLVPICFEQSRGDPLVADTLTRLEKTESWKRTDLLMQTGWATMPGAAEPSRTVANACMEMLEKNF